MTALDELLAANHRYPTVFEKGTLPPAPTRQVAVLTCMDGRLDPARFLGLEEGDAHVIRNAGGRASDDAIRSLAISQQVLGTREIVVIHHTECGMLALSNARFRALLKRRLGVDASGIDFLPFAHLEQGVRDDVERLRASPLLLSDAPIAGLLYDVHTGRLSRVV